MYLRKNKKKKATPISVKDRCYSKAEIRRGSRGWFFIVDAYHILAGMIVRGENLKPWKARDLYGNQKRRIRDGWSNDSHTPCCYCGTPLGFQEITIEHVKPRCIGGSNDITNLLPCCDDCNKLRGRIFMMMLTKARALERAFISEYHPERG